jgi:hypothetical protein
MTAAAASVAEAGLDHLLVSLGPPDPGMARQARDSGLSVRGTPDLRSLRALVAEADIVLIHFWNSPALYQLLGTSLPKMRLLVWAHVAGETPPEVLPPELLKFADVVLASCEHTTTLGGLEQLGYIPAVPGWDRLCGIRPSPAGEFTVGYLGKLDFSKLHPEFIGLCASVALPRARFLVCGEGGASPLLRRQAAGTVIAGRVEFRGFVEDIERAFADMDVFGYPLAPTSYAASELALQEAMYAGVPPVVMGPPAVHRQVIDGETGLVANSGDDYVRAIEYLNDHPEERARIGRSAHEFAARMWSPSVIASRWVHVYEELAARPKRKHPPFPLAENGAARFVQSLGGMAQQFSVSMTANDEDAFASDQDIACSPGVLCTSDGGVFGYRDFYPDDPFLRLWSGLILRQHGRPAVAAGEFAAAIRLGLNDSRVRPYLDAAVRELGAAEVAQRSCESAP